MGKKSVARINKHHIVYDPEWVVEVNYTQHRVITTIQRTKATPERYADLTNFVHSILHEWGRMRMELDTGLDLRIPQMKGKKNVKHKSKSKAR